LTIKAIVTLVIALVECNGILASLKRSISEDSIKFMFFSNILQLEVCRCIINLENQIHYFIFSDI